jgi:hypothetical protein
MRVDDLPSGREQPFYDSVDTTGNHRCEPSTTLRTHSSPLQDHFFLDVAECNIIPDAPTPTILEMARAEIQSFGRYFSGTERNHKTGRGRLLMSPELALRYPDDDAYGAAWATADQGDPVVE